MGTEINFPNLFLYKANGFPCRTGMHLEFFFKSSDNIYRDGTSGGLLCSRNS